MHFKIQFCTFIILEIVKDVRGDKPFTLVLEPNEVVESFKAIVSSDYIKHIANDLASKAAEHFLNKLKTHESSLSHSDLENRQKTKKHTDEYDDVREEEPMLKFVKMRETWINKAATRRPKHDRFKLEVTTEKPILNEDQAMSLLDDPSPDGDNLDEANILTDAEVETNKPIPVIGVMKINGVYYRRLLGVI